jgi:hypothetical protein
MMAWSLSKVYPEDWNLPGDQYPELDQSLWAPNTFDHTSLAISGASQSMNHASPTANLPTQHDSYGKAHDLAGPPLTSIFSYEVPASSLQTTSPPKKEISLPENYRTNDLEGGVPSHNGKDAE